MPNLTGDPVHTGSGYKVGPFEQERQQQQQQQNQNGNQQQQQQENEPGPIEILAMKMGWNPEHDETSGREFKTAEQFILDSKEMQDTTVKTLRSVQRQNDELVQGMQHLRQTHKKSMEVEQRRIDDEIAKLKADKDSAIENADKEAVNKLDTQIQTLENDKRDLEVPAQSQQQQTGSAQSFEQHRDAWLEKNPWFGTGPQADPVMTEFINVQSERFRGLPDEMYFQRLSEAAMTAFPDKFPGQQLPSQQNTPPAQQQQQQQGNQQQAANTVVGGQTRQTGAGQKQTYTFDDLSGEQKRMALFYERNKVMSRQEYVDEQVKIKNIPGM